MSQADRYRAVSQHLRAFVKPNESYETFRAQLNPDELIRVARESTGLSDFGNDSFMEPYRKLLDCAARDVPFTEGGLKNFRENVVRCLVNKLRIHRDFTQHPEILAEDVSDPIVVIGMPRSGTTRLHWMLSTLPDNEIQKTYIWQLLNPAPFPEARPGMPDPRIAAMGLDVSSQDDKDQNEHWYNSLGAAHALTTQDPDEDTLLFDLTFDDWFWAQAYAPSISYYEWVMQRPHMNNYVHLRTMLQYLQWQNGGRQNRPWVLKNVQHIAYMRELVTCFPNATIVHCHRSPYNSVPSLAKFFCAMWSPVVGTADPIFAGQVACKWLYAAISAYMETRDQLRLDEKIFDVAYPDICKNSTGLAAEIYRRAGRPLSSAQLALLDARHLAESNTPHQSHSYSLEEVGLTREQIAADFGEYIERFHNFH